MKIDKPNVVPFIAFTIILETMTKASGAKAFSFSAHRKKDSRTS
jgi:hypothetical protein